jgi:hypothetical protein
MSISLSSYFIVMVILLGSAPQPRVPFLTTWILSVYRRHSSLLKRRSIRQHDGWWTGDVSTKLLRRCSGE